MTFSIQKERLTAVSSNGIPMGYITFPQIRPGLVNINLVVTYPAFRGQGVADSMLDALLVHLTEKNLKAALTAPHAQHYVETHPQWKHILPGEIRCVTY